MAGGLLQLISIGKQDAPLIINPEITFFKTVYRKHTNFSLEQILKEIGLKRFNTFHQYKIEKFTDLIGGLHFIVDIPYTNVNINKTSIITTTNNLLEDINELSVIINNVKTYLYYDTITQKYYLISKNFFNIAHNDNYYDQISGSDLENNLLNGLNFISTLNYGYLVDMLQLKNSKLNQILPILRLDSNQWTDYWLYILDNNTNFNYFTKNITQLNLVSILQNKLKLILFDYYVNYNIFNNYTDYLLFSDEIYNYFNNITNDSIYDSDFAYDYAIINNLDSNIYINNALQYNSLFYSFLLESLYPNFTNGIKSFTFWKKYNLGLNNIVTTFVSNFNYYQEWLNRFSIYNANTYGNYTKILLQIFEIYQKDYYLCELNIKTLFEQFDVKEKEKTWCILKTFYNFYTNENTICFDNINDLNISITNYFNNNYTTLQTTDNLLLNLSNFDDPNYIQPVDLNLIYLYLLYNYVNSINTKNLFENPHFLKIWRNKINIAFYFRMAQNFDNYNTNNISSDPLQNIFLSLNDYNDITKKLTFYHNINLNNNISTDTIRQELINTIYCESFYGSINYNQNIESNIIDFVSYNNQNYNIINQNVTIIDIKNINNYTKSNNIITIDIWNNHIYDKIYLNNIQVTNFVFSNNSLTLILEQNYDLTNIQLKLIKNLKVPILQINNIIYPNINDNKIRLFEKINNITTINNINNNFITINIYNVGLTFYQLSINYNDLTNEKINVLIKNNLILTDINIDYFKINSIDLLSYNFNLELIIQNPTIINNIIDNNTGTNNNIYWLIDNDKVKFIPVKYQSNQFYIYGDISGNYNWNLYVNTSSCVPNLFDILHYPLNIDQSGNVKNYELNSQFYQLPFMMPIQNNSSLFYFYNFPISDITQEILVNDNKVNIVFDIQPKEFYDISGQKISSVFDITQQPTYINKTDILNNLVTLFDTTMLHDAKYSEIINLIENTNNLYKKLIMDTIDTLKNLGKTINQVINNSIKLNDTNIIQYNNYDFNIYSLFSPSYYNLDIDTSFGLNKLKLKNKGQILLPIKNIYKSHEKISSSYTTYLNTVSTTLQSHITYINSYQDLINIYQTNQYQEKLDYKYKLENIINQNIFTTSNYTIQTLYDLSGNYSNSNTEIYLNDIILLDISSNNIVSNNNIFEIKDETAFKTEIFYKPLNDYDINKFNYLGPINFYNGEIYTKLDYFPSQTTLLLLDDLTIKQMSNFNENNLIIYSNSFEINTSSLINIPKNNEKYVYIINFVFNINTSLQGNSILINNILFNLYDTLDGNYILSGDFPLYINNNYIISGNSDDGTMSTFKPLNTNMFISYTIIKYFLTNTYYTTNSVVNNIVTEIDGIFKILDVIYDNTTLYLSNIMTDNTIELLSFTKTDYPLSPFKMGNKTIIYETLGLNYFSQNYDENYYYKLNDYICKGSDIKESGITGNYNVWIYPNNYLKYINTGLFANIDIFGTFTYIVKMNLDSDDNITEFNKLSEYKYYLIGDKVFYFNYVNNSLNELIIYGLSLLFNNFGIQLPVYLIDDSNFKNIDSQFIYISNNTFTETILPSTNYDKNENIKSNWFFDFPNEHINNEIDIILNFTDITNNLNFSYPITFTSNTNIIQTKIIYNLLNYNSFFVYNDSDGDIINGKLESLTTLYSTDSDLIIDNNNNFTLNKTIGLKKYKLYDDNNNYCYIWTLYSTSDYQTLTQLTNILYQPIIVETDNVQFMTLNTGFDIFMNNNNLITILNSNLYFTNKFNNITKNQRYYSDIILNNNYNIYKNEFNFNYSSYIQNKTSYIGYTNNINGKQITFNTPLDNNIKYFIFISLDNKYFRKPITINDNVVYLDTELEQNNYSVICSTINIYFTNNSFTLYYQNNIYYISSYNSNMLKINDIIMFDENIFEIKGLNSLTLCYELIPIKIVKLKNIYNGYYLLYSLCSKPLEPKYDKNVDFTINDISENKLYLNEFGKIIIGKTNNYFSIKDNENIYLYIKNNYLYNPYNYLLNINDYLIYNSVIYQIKYIIDNKIYLYNNIDVNEGFYSFYYPFQPCNVKNIIFDSNSSIYNQKNWDINVYYEINNYFTNIPPLYNYISYTRTITLPTENLYFEKINNQTINSSTTKINNSWTLFNSTYDQEKITSTKLNGYGFAYSTYNYINGVKIGFFHKKFGCHIGLSSSINPLNDNIMNNLKGNPLSFYDYSIYYWETYGDIKFKINILGITKYSGYCSIDTKFDIIYDGKYVKFYFNNNEQLEYRQFCGSQLSYYLLVVPHVKNATVQINDFGPIATTQSSIVIDNITNYNFYLNQKLLINSNTVTSIKNIDVLNNKLFLSDYNLPLNFTIIQGKKNNRHIYSNYELDNMCCLKPKINLDIYNCYDISNNIILNYNTSTTYDPSKVCFMDNVLNVNNQNNVLYLDGSYHVLLEKTIYNQYITHICKIMINNKLFILTPIENYNSTFYLDKIYPITLLINNSYYYNDIIIYKQTELSSIPSNYLTIWKKYEITINSIIESITDSLYNYQVEIDITQNNLPLDLLQKELYIDKSEQINIYNNLGIYYLQFYNFPQNLKYIYIKEINYVKTLIKNNYNTLINLNSIFDKTFGYESIKLPLDLTFNSYVDNYYYSIDIKINYIDNKYNNSVLTSEFSVEYLNLNIIETYIEQNQRILVSNNKLLLSNYFYINNNLTNIFNEDNIYLDSYGGLKNIFMDTYFNPSIFFNCNKTWNTWSILSNPDSNIIALFDTTGHLGIDISGNYFVKSFYIPSNISKIYDNNINYYTKTEKKILADYLLTFIRDSSGNDIYMESYNNYNKLKQFETNLYYYLNNIIYYNEFWLDPITFINNFANDISSGLYIDINNNICLSNTNQNINYLILNNQFDLLFDIDVKTVIVVRDNSKITTEIHNFINNEITSYIYGIQINDAIQTIIKMSNDYKTIINDFTTFNFKNNNFADIFINIIKNQLNNNKLNTTFTIDSLIYFNVNLVDNYVTFDNLFDNVLYIAEYPYNPTTILNQINIPYQLNYSIDTQVGLYQYNIYLTNEIYNAYTIYKIDFLEGYLKMTIDDPVIYNNEIIFYEKQNFNSNDFSVASYKTYDVSSNFIGYVYEFDTLVIDLTKFTDLLYKNLNLEIYNQYIIFPEDVITLTSYIQAEMNIFIYNYIINSNNTTTLELVNLNQVFDVNSSEYSIYICINNLFYKILSIINTTIVINGDISKTNITKNLSTAKFILTIKPENISSKNLVLYKLNLSEDFLYYTYYNNLKSIKYNFLLNNNIYINDIKFIDTNIFEVLIDKNNITTINNIVHYSKLGEFPPEPLQNINIKSSYLYQFNDLPPINNKTNCFIYHDISLNLIDDAFILNKISDINFTYISSSDIIITTNTQFIADIYINNIELKYNTFGGVINPWNITNYIYINNVLSFDIPIDFIYNSTYYYSINDIIIEQNNFIINKNTITINIILDSPINIIFKQIIIEKNIIKPINNQLCDINLFYEYDLKFGGYLQILDNIGTEIGTYVIKINTNYDLQIINNNTQVILNGDVKITGTILITSPLYIITNQKPTNVTYLTYINNIEYIEVLSFIIEQYAYIPFTLYQNISLTNYKIFIQEQNVLTNNIIHNINDINKYFVISKFDNLILNNKYNNKIITPTPELVLTTTTTIVNTIVQEPIKLKPDIYKLFFESIDFYISDQLVEGLNKDIMDIQYQFLKDQHKRKQFNLMTKIYNTDTGYRFMIPLEFWFNSLSTMYLPVIAFKYTDLFLRLKINSIDNLIDNINYSFDDIPTINIQLNIDGILLDTVERELFGHNAHEYIIEKFKQYPDILINKKECSSHLLFKNLIKDMFFSTEIVNTKDKTYFETTIIADSFSTYFYNKKRLYNEFIKTGIYSETIPITNSYDFNIIKNNLNEILLSSSRITYFKNSLFISPHDIELTLFLDSKYNNTNNSLGSREKALVLYYIKTFKNEIINKPINPINNMNISSNGMDLFVKYNSSYFNLVVPFQKYHTSVDEGYYGYSFALHPLDKQPSGHLNFNVLDNIVINTINVDNVVNMPFILKTITREYQIIRIMSGMAGLAWND